MSAPTASSRSIYRGAFVAALIYLILALAPFVSSLRPSRFAFGTDTVAHDIPLSLYAWEATNDWSGRLPLWSPQLRGGLPMIGSFAFMPFYPPNWLGGLAVALAPAFPDGPTSRLNAYTFVHTLQWPLHHALAAFFMFLFLCATIRDEEKAIAEAAVDNNRRRQQWPRPGPFLGGLVFGLAPHLVTLTYPGHLAKVQAIAWMPGALWCLTRDASGRVRPLGAGVCLAMPMLAGHPQIAVYAALLAGVWCAWQATDSRCWRPLARLAAAGGLAFLLAAPQLLPGIEMKPHSNRATLSYDEAIKSSYPPVELIELLVPRHRGDSVLPALGGLGTYSGPWGERLVSDYLGALPATLALLGFLCGTSISAAWRRERWLWLGVFLFALVHCLGGYLGDYYRLFLRVMPFAGSFRSPATLMVLLPFALAPLAARGFEFLLAHAARRPGPAASSGPAPLAPPLFARLRFVAALIAIPLGLIFYIILSHFGPFADYAHYLRQRHSHLLWAQVVFNRSIGFSVVPLLVVLAAIVARRRLAAPGRARFRLAAALLLLACAAADLLAINRVFVRAAPTDGLVAQSQAHYGDGTRHLPIGGGPHALLLRGHELSLWPMYRGRFANPWGYHPITLARSDAAMSALGYDDPAFLTATNTTAIIEADGRVTARRSLPASIVVDKLFPLTSLEQYADFMRSHFVAAAPIEARDPHPEIPASGAMVEGPVESLPALASHAQRFNSFVQEGLNELLFLLAPLPPTVAADESIAALLAVPYYPGATAEIIPATSDLREDLLPVGLRAEMRPANLLHTLAVWRKLPAQPAGGAAYLIRWRFLPGSERWGILLAATGIMVLAAGAGRRLPERRRRNG